MERDTLAGGDGRTRTSHRVAKRELSFTGTCGERRGEASSISLALWWRGVGLRGLAHPPSLSMTYRVPTQPGTNASGKAAAMA